MFARLCIVYERIALGSVHELEMSRSWLPEY
jgi:hypothetical protein